MAGFARISVVPDVAGVGDRAGEPVELGDHQGVAGPHGREGLVQAGPGAAGAGESLVEVDPVFGAGCDNKIRLNSVMILSIEN